MRFQNLFAWSQFLVFACCGTAQAAGSLFDSDEILDVDLRGPLAQTIADSKERNGHAFELSVDGQEVSVAVRVRGNSRVRVCRFPPLRIDFSSQDAKGTPFEGQSKLKLVTHCKTGASYEQNVLEEYAAYRIFSMLSDVSLRTRLLRIRYFDTGQTGSEPLIRYGFLIESDKALAARTQGEVLRSPHVVKTRLDLDQAALAFVFHYLIANTDWSLVTATGAKNCCHNGVLVAIAGRHYLVPYDFDLAGIVDAPYARPDASAGIRSVRDRRYRGYCIDEARIVDALQTALDREVGIARMIRSLPGATEKESNKRLKYLGRFYKAAEDVEKFARKLNQRCIDQ